MLLFVIVFLIHSLHFSATQECTSSSFDFANHVNNDELDLTTPPDTVIASFPVEHVRSVTVIVSEAHPLYINVRIADRLLEFFTTEHFPQYEEREVQVILLLQMTYGCTTGEKRGLYRQKLKLANNHAPKFLEERYAAQVPLPLPKNFDISPFLADGRGIMARDIDLVNNAVVFGVSENDYVYVESRQVDGDTRYLGWNVPPEELVHIPEHWLQYAEPEASLHYLLGLLYIAFTVFSLIGNGLVIWIFVSAKSLRTPSNIFVINLAICDFFMMAKTPIFIYNSFTKGFTLGSVGCQIFAVIGSLTGIGAGTTNALIAYDRYNTITRPFEGRLSRTKAIILVCLVWMYAIPWAVLPLLEIWGRFVPEGFLTSCTFDYLGTTFDNRLFVATIFTFSYVLPMSLIIFYYSHIVSHVINHEKTLREQAKKMNVDSLRSNQNKNDSSVEIRIAKAAITVCFLFVASWTPYGVMALIGSFGDKSLLTPGVTMFPACACKFVACLDPYVYAISHPRYRVELQKRMPWLAITETLPAETATTCTEPDGQTAT
ncbi:opsin, ultraviolet-sensitive-like isoform X2 [Anopheles cruzii]|uniref:opsin, ultraviolet-sensitive-like isoform X2 n=1 Tax=Anopheles cruzii TaxID=68878 RepID=UPI0022EC909A|nr:opsin, ultraviolet-sensitive-like isoform X2 [Anopheles cruzii]